MEIKSKSPVHLCEIIDTCCLNKISRSVVTEILKFILVFIFMSILIEIVELILITLYRLFYCQDNTTNAETPSNILPNVTNESNTKTKSLFQSSVNLNPQSYEFNFV